MLILSISLSKLRIQPLPGKTVPLHCCLQNIFAKSLSEAELWSLLQGNNYGIVADDSTAMYADQKSVFFAQRKYCTSYKTNYHCAK